MSHSVTIERFKKLIDRVESQHREAVSLLVEGDTDADSLCVAYENDLEILRDALKANDHDDMEFILNTYTTEL